MLVLYTLDFPLSSPLAHFYKKPCSARFDRARSAGKLFGYELIDFSFYPVDPLLYAHGCSSKNRNSFMFFSLSAASAPGL